MRDLNLREVSALAPLLVLIVILGFYPRPLTEIINPAVDATLQHIGVSDPQPDVAGGSTSGTAGKEAGQ